MTFILNIVLGWVSVVLVFLLSVIYILRVVNKQFFDNKQPTLKKLNKGLRKPHILLGKLALLTAFIHGLTSTGEILSFNYGTYVFVFMLLLGVSFMLKKQLKAYMGFMFYHRILTLITIVLLVIHLIDIGIMGPTNFINGAKLALGQYEVSEVVNTDQLDTEEVPEDVVVLNNGRLYEDGIYTGVATGFGEGLTVEVIILDNQITSVEVVAHNEMNENFWGIPVELIPGQIVSTQDPVVDVVTGASMTSTGIINATINALEQALIEGELPDPVELSNNKGKGKH